MRKLKNLLFAIVLAGLMAGCTGSQSIKESSAKNEDKNAKSNVILAQTPPLGWNSFDSYSITIYEEVALKEIDAFIDKFAPHGYGYFVIDNALFASPKTVMHKGYMMAIADKPDPSECSVNEYGIPVPSKQFFPKGLKPMVDKLHDKGLKFGVHIMRGILFNHMELYLLNIHKFKNNF